LPSTAALSAKRHQGVRITLGTNDRRTVLGGAIAILFPIAYAVACGVLPAGSLALTAVSDVGFVPLEVFALVLACTAMLKSKQDRGRWIWAWVVAWLVLNLFGDVVWSVYELSGLDVPSPSIADLGYLLSYVAGFGAVLAAARQATGALRTIETSLDAAMFTIGAAGLCWPLIMGPLLQTTDPGAGWWVNLAYPIGDLLILFAFAAFFLGLRGSTVKPRAYYIVLCVGFLTQTVADSGYYVLTSNEGLYVPGNWMDPVWLFAYAFASIAALLELRRARQTTKEARAAESPSIDLSSAGFVNSPWRILIPYVGIPLVGGMFIWRLHDTGWAWTTDTRVLAYLGMMLIVLLLVRQYVTLAQNRRLNVKLTNTSSELAEKLAALADLNSRLEGLNGQIHVLNSLRDQRSIAEEGLEMACSFSKAPGGWITLRNDEGIQVVNATKGPVALHKPGDSRFNALEVAKGVLSALPIECRSENLGTLWLVRPETTERTPDLLPVIAGQIGTALDNSRSYQEALHLAERDALTGLFNHRGIHKRLAGESLRAQQNHTQLSLIMLDMDDFKILNDTYGHPVGDSVLRHLSDSIRGVLRHADLAGRVGGDELLLVMPNTDHEGAMLLGERLRERLSSRPFLTDAGDPITVHISLGVATFPTDADSLAELIEIADNNLYVSKQRGGDAVTGSSAEEGEPGDTASLLGVAGKLLDVVGARDHYTRKHSERVALYALSLGHSLGLSDSSLSTLHVAAMLHDVGKIGVSADLLRRPTSLSPAEEDMVRRHVELSTAVIKDMPRLAQVAEAVNSHHEWHNGSGYPSEKAGGDIPLLGRILAVADAYSAMITDRPYRKGLSAGEARAELVRAAGTQLDPELVRQFLHLIDTRVVEPAVVKAEVGEPDERSAGGRADRADDRIGASGRSRSRP
jgi:diguanylate cyclase (GGDEF)-like protein